MSDVGIGQVTPTQLRGQCRAERARRHRQVQADRRPRSEARERRRRSEFGSRLDPGSASVVRRSRWRSVRRCAAVPRPESRESTAVPPDRAQPPADDRDPRRTTRSPGPSGASNSTPVRRLDASEPAGEPGSNSREKLSRDLVKAGHDAGVEYVVLFGGRHLFELGGGPDLVGHLTRVARTGEPSGPSAASTTRSLHPTIDGCTTVAGFPMALPRVYRPMRSARCR